MEDKKELNLEEMEGASGGDAAGEFLVFEQKMLAKYGPEGLGGNWTWLHRKSGSGIMNYARLQSSLRKSCWA